MIIEPCPNERNANLYFFITINKKFVSDVPGLREELQVHLPQHPPPDLLHAAVVGRGPG
jgi:hypothetical protein